MHTPQLVLVFGAADETEVEKFLASFRVNHLPIVISPKLVDAFQVTSIPYGFAVDESGIIRGKGITNTADHIESLANTVRYGVASIEALDMVQSNNGSEIVVTK